jgi:hypothetical protein
MPSCGTRPELALSSVIDLRFMQILRSYEMKPLSANVAARERNK